MSLTLIESEVHRFLSNSTPEVLCIKGKWGVGKTYGWKKFLSDAERQKALALKRYSYVSLFGLNSLDDLRFSIFENTVSHEEIGNGADVSTFSRLLDKSSDFARRVKPAVEFLSAAFNRKGVGDVLFKSAFLSVREQLICLDDLERAGAGLNARDVLGLASLLKEDRKCKVVLLLNDKEHDQKEEFERQLEKVADVTLVFDLTSDEATSIALTGSNRATTILKQRASELGISNIRVIKKIERLAVELATILDGLDDSVIERAVATLTLASWSVLQPKEAPPLSLLRSYNPIAIAMRAGRESVDSDTERFRSLLQDYPFPGPEAFDHLVIDGAIAGYFATKNVRKTAEEMQTRWRRNPADSAFSRAWQELYHGSFSTDDDVFLDALYESACEEVGSISATNINGAIRTLREFSRSAQAEDLIARCIMAHQHEDPNFFDIKGHHFSQDDRLDDGLRDAFAAKRKEFIDARDPFEVLTSIGERQSWDDADGTVMAMQSVDDFERMFETLSGTVLRSAVQTILAMGNSHVEGAATIREAARSALKRIALKSPIRARKMARYGIVLNEEPESKL